jgi:hypothetical protein
MNGIARLPVRRLWRSVALGLAALVLLSAPLWILAADVTPLERAAFGAAMLDAMSNGNQAEVSRNLLAVVPGDDTTNQKVLHNGHIKWEGEPGASRVLVACFMSRATYTQYYKDNLDQHQPTYTLTKSLWVTVVPELKNHFVDGPCPPSRKRVVAALGLNPAFDYQVILEMWVDPDALFRPAPDPEATDHEATVSARSLDGWVFANDTNPFLQFSDATFVDHQGATPYTFRQWFAWNATQAYKMSDPKDLTTWGAPWTRLGYTYDWGKVGENHVGLSEFMVRIDPAANGGQLTVTLSKAIDCSTGAWNAYFKCDSSATVSEESAQEEKAQSEECGCP